MRCLCFVAALVAGGGDCRAAPEPGWTVARSAHFEVYSQSGPDAARSTLTIFEQLRGFFAARMNLELTARPPVRVISFRSLEQYNSYRLRPTADAYYVGTESRDTIVMPAAGPGRVGVAAHEYAHVLLHARGQKIPTWLNEGLAELFSSVRMDSKGSSIGGDLPARSQDLKRAWMPLVEVFAATADSEFRNDRGRDALFYAESWALAHMLALAPQYRARFDAFTAACADLQSTEAAFDAIYGKSVDAVNRDLHVWIEGARFTPVMMPAVAAGTVKVETAEMPPLAAQQVLAEVLFDAGELDRAAALYRELSLASPRESAIPAALGAIALRRGDREGARREWSRALDGGLQDAFLCYRYAVLAGDAGLSAAEIRPVLERAVVLRPDFDDARYALALLEMNAGHYEAAVAQFGAMKVVPAVRQYDYWSGLGYCLNEIGRREQAKAASREAARYASTPEERAHAQQIAFIADTDMTVRFTRDAQGRAQMQTTRAPHGDTNWNPFIEPADHMRHVEGTLREIRCEGGATRFVVAAADQHVILTIADPGKVLMRNAPAEFTCGPQQPPAPVKVDYAAVAERSGGVIRGMEFLLTSPHTGESQSHGPSPHPH